MSAGTWSLPIGFIATSGSARSPVSASTIVLMYSRKRSMPRGKAYRFRCTCSSGTKLKPMLSALDLLDECRGTTWFPPLEIQLHDSVPGLFQDRGVRWRNRGLLLCEGVVRA